MFNLGMYGIKQFAAVINPPQVSWASDSLLCLVCVQGVTANSPPCSQMQAMLGEGEVKMFPSLVEEQLL